MQKFLLFLFWIAASLACTTAPATQPINGIPFDGTAYKPIYSSAEDLAKVKISAAEPLAEPGKIYLFDPYIFINESGKGIHIIDNSDPKNPKNLSFISITGNYDMAVKDNWLYADNLSNLLVFDIGDPKAPKLTKTIENAIPINSFPPHTNIYFECPEAKKGIVVGWEKVTISEQPKCFR
ncbi:hypothetical protein [Dyadobacter sp. CY323]|uniref:hypothetical protein n=1 Tax=Dyadobacter sp. CY323 TaxID=2907302 RepID=UPI001F48EDC6|nr:hypothetical protein [Dyadobacter sp. CY323]MCE6992770.1 hypothetical protein [Dyadobacter sp. CY323]